MRIMLVLCGALLAGCQPAQPEASNPTPAPESGPPASAVTASPALPISAETAVFLGKWTGPEGTSLQISPFETELVVEIHSLDGSATYRGVRFGDRIHFRRNDKNETLRRTDGAETGMKWLLDKKDCLTIEPGEGFCRD